MEIRAPRSIRHIDPTAGLHRLKRFQKRFLAEQCLELAEQLDQTIHATFKAAPVRVRPYIAIRTKVTENPAHREAQLERALHRQWSTLKCQAATGCWERLVAFQVNLPDKKKAEGWGEIDLLGVAPDGLPVVVELKKDMSQEPPANLLVQAAAYGLVLQKAWWTFRGEWMTHTAPRIPLPTALDPCRLACAAPAGYWASWKLDDNTRSALSILRRAFELRGLTTTWVSIGGSEGRYTASPVDIA